MAEKEREQKKEAAAAWSSDWAAVSPWYSHWNFAMEEVDFWIESVPCSNCGNVYLRGHMYVGKRQKAMWCYACDETTRGGHDPCFISIADGKYPEIPARNFWRWLEYVENRGLEERRYGPGLGTDPHALGSNWNVEVL